MSVKITLLTMGGTIDGADSDKGTLREISDSAVWLQQQPGIDVRVIKICNKDSREIDNGDRQLAVDEAIHADDKIIVTHGTFTIAETGQFLKQRFENSGKTIRLVGAWIPFNEPETDAARQMQFALNDLLNDPQMNVRIAMDGQLWDPDVTEKVKVAPEQFKLVAKKPVGNTYA